MLRGPSVRAVADTNTVVSAFLWGGLPAEILTAACEQRLSLFNKFAQRIARVGSTAAALIEGYRALVQLVRTTAVAPVSRDPDDDQVLACALAADAHLIVTRDRDLRTLDPFHTIRILPAREALALIAEQKD
jgi:uncharacterized protein